MAVGDPVPMMKNILTEERFSCVSDSDKAFIVAFNDAVTELGYDFGGNIGGGIALRLYFSDIDTHGEFIEKAPPHINNVFAGKGGDCTR